jgi:RimJ/RimL family protein N-acetyltransferase
MRLGMWPLEMMRSSSGLQKGLGNIALTLDIAHPGVAEVMYWLAASARGRGIATEAVVLLCDWAFREINLRRITLKTLRGNVRSQKVAERAGFRLMSEPVSSEEDYLWFELTR